MRWSLYAKSHLGFAALDYWHRIQSKPRTANVSSAHSAQIKCLMSLVGAAVHPATSDLAS
jgi:hypothetical protein